MTYTIWLVLAVLLLFTHSYLRRRLRRQTRELNRTTTRYDAFVRETHRLRRQSDRDADRAIRQQEHDESRGNDRPG